MTDFALSSAELAAIIENAHKLERGEAVAWPVDAETYHADRVCASGSQLEALIASPALFEGRFVTGEIGESDETKALRIGKLLHLCFLEPERWDGIVRPRPEHIDRRTKLGKDAYERWLADLPPGAIEVTPAEYDLVLAMAGALNRHPSMATLLAAEGANELSAIWREPTTGVLVRVRFDRLLQLTQSRRIVVLDIKTTDDPSPRAFGESCARYGYARQAALYSDVAAALTGASPVRYSIFPVRKTPPHEAACYELGKDELALGRRQYRALLSDLARRRADNDWSAPWQRGEHELGLPGWAHTQELF